MEFGERFVSAEKTAEEEKRERLRNLLLQAASEGKGIRQPLMIGDTLVNDQDHTGITFEESRDELYRLIDGGYVKLDSHFRPQLTDKGIEALVG